MSTRSRCHAGCRCARSRRSVSRSTRAVDTIFWRFVRAAERTSLSRLHCARRSKRDRHSSALAQDACAQENAQRGPAEEIRAKQGGNIPSDTASKRRACASLARFSFGTQYLGVLPPLTVRLLTRSTRAKTTCLPTFGTRPVAPLFARRSPTFHRH